MLCGGEKQIALPTEGLGSLVQYSVHRLQGNTRSAGRVIMGHVVTRAGAVEVGGYLLLSMEILLDV